ncbi:hypothetical protein A3F02_02030 [Candidatus Curtissbacteria bacterium RIFCSPHIGHO2_12_FULL_38_9b]|uniref:Uncharacterized protein n=2 Tax=Candidatus Curtissiibacteriota TaxID=1752717 RepID=A0A1F5GY11_9BACT|nr:MAG: hypothetical protein A3A48_00395 [Candidatus Curtissbacteria bacterium RIFCSPLOWO2_01_FULL_37_9]OGD96657.1 MAG: hypothetical protein A3F02_02030 [Candidatus Curtissbacteria bacterium RIFCSPHIGHO2_12_FULL_38_9b]
MYNVFACFFLTAFPPPILTSSLFSIIHTRLEERILAGRQNKSPRQTRWASVYQTQFLISKI